MSRSMSITRDNPIEDYNSPTAFNVDEQTQLVVSKTPAKVSHTERIEDSKNNLLTEHEEQIDYTVGSGTRGCSYFVDRGGKLYQSPVTYYAKSKTWGLSPGYDPVHHPRFGRMASDGCLACHAGRMNPVQNERNTFDSSKPFHELAIGCERCHGPAEDHIRFHESDSRPKNTRDPIVNPENLDPKLRDAVCYQCHLQGTNRVVRYGRTEYDFRPGMHVSDIWITFLKSGKSIDGKTDAVSQVEQMQQSRCFIASQGELGCISCHDPHRSPGPQERTLFYRDKCINCHKNENSQPTCTSPLETRKKESPADSCIACHMPKLNAGDVPHTSQTDHRVQVPGKRFESQTEEKDGLRIWNDKPAPSFAIARAKIISKSEPAFMKSDRQLADKAMQEFMLVHPVAEDDLALKESLAQLYSTIDDPVEANQLWSGLIKVFPRDEFLLNQISLALHQSGKFEEAYPYYRQLVKVNNSRPPVLLRFLDVCTKLSRFPEGIKIANRVIELEPGSKITHQWLAKAYETAGETEKAEHHRELAKRLPGKK